MGANTKRRTTMAKLNRETRQREKRMEKEARKAARKLEQGMPDRWETSVEEDASAPEGERAD
jgi:hypothetical protein